MLIFQYHEKAESALKDYLADLIAKKVSTSFKLHRKDKMHLQLEPQKLPGLGLDFNFTGPKQLGKMESQFLRQSPAAFRTVK